MGDAVGAPIEFWSLSEIGSRLGPGGVTGYVGGSGAVTDDTQMALFTAEGLVRASVQQRSGAAADRSDTITGPISAGSVRRDTTALAGSDAPRAILASVNHSGDSTPPESFVAPSSESSPGTSPSPPVGPSRSISPTW
ncbi:MAG TPA: ADP-ribosylglycohydrolase family protein [Acidimicrobiia bacterium]|nr:ADP-ribosylglycohydrolase family protein [Acidimicrobiia bacterium]